VALKIESHYSTRTIAKFFDVKVATVSLWIRQGRLKATRGANKVYRVAHEDLVKFAHEHYGIEIEEDA
jgi:predicted site-specific integrase-resolvase